MQATQWNDSSMGLNRSTTISMLVLDLLSEELTTDWEYTSLLKTFGAKKSSSFRVTTKTEADTLLKSPDFGTGKEIQLVDVVMPVMDAPRALVEQAKLLEKANRRADDQEIEGSPVNKKRKVDKVAATVNGIGFHGLTNGAETLV